jgi:hypothetical protein
MLCLAIALGLLLKMRRIDRFADALENQVNAIS